MPGAGLYGGFGVKWFDVDRFGPPAGPRLMVPLISVSLGCCGACGPGAQSRVVVCCGPAVYAAGRRTTPCGISPVVTSCHSATSNLRAREMIMVLRVALRASAVRTRYHCASAVSF